MNLKTYDKIMDIFYINKGFMSFETLQENKVTYSQIKELENRKTLYRFARGWYWCNECGYNKPENFKYIAISKVNPEAIICLKSAAHIWHLVESRPEVVDVAIARSDRKQMEFDFKIHRCFLKNTTIEGEVITIGEELGNFNAYDMGRTVCDCIRMNSFEGKGQERELIEEYYKHGGEEKQLYAYAKELRALRTIQRFT